MTASSDPSPAGGLTADDVISILSLQADRHWVRSLADVGPPPFGLALPPPSQASLWLAELGVERQDAADIVATMPSPGTDRAWWWLLERSVHRLANEMGDPEPWHVSWPDWTAAVAGRTLAQRCYMAHVYLAMLPVTRAWHASRGVPPEVSQSSFADLARHLAIHRRIFASTGIDNAWWLSLSLRGEVYDLGRLQFTYFNFGSGDQTIWWYPPDEAAERGPGFLAGESCIGVHIPDGSPLTPQACDESFRLAAEFMPVHFPPPAGQERRLATCWSWLLDDQLAAMLPSDSNIVKF
ncbi:MAG TPA: acyltransferase domain-containing protein, partial [Acidimicrobiales bacterium]|nr:acyltransferase domain-containing protein [Acidimicrobiales bacterium]